MELNRELLMSYLFIYLFIIEGEYGTDSNFESEWTDSESEMEGNWSDDVLSDNKPRSSLRGKRIHQKNCFSEDLFSVTSSAVYHIYCHLLLSLVILTN